MAMATEAAFPRDTSEAMTFGKAVVRSMFIDYLMVVPFGREVKAIYSSVLEHEEQDLLAVQPTEARKSLVVYGAVAIEEDAIFHVAPLLALGADQTQNTCASYALASSSIEYFYLDGLGLEEPLQKQQYVNAT